MKRKIIEKLLKPPYRIIITVDIIAMLFVIYALVKLRDTSPASFAAYLLSAYALTVTIMNFSSMIQYTKELVKSDKLKIVVAIRRLMRKNKYTARYLDDREFRAETALYTGLVINLFYAAFKIGTGYRFSSVWYYSLGAYYLVFGFIRFFLMRNVRKNYRESDENNARLREAHTYRNCGVLMFLMNITMSFIAAQMVIKNEGDKFSKTVVILTAAYTFYCFILALCNMISFRRARNMIISAAQNLTFAGALMSVYSLQTSMLTAFNEDDRSGFRQLMNGITGAGVTVIVLVMSILMISKGNKRIKRLHTKDADE